MTTNPLPLAAVRAIKEEANVILDSKHWGEMKREAFMERLQHTPALCDTIETLVEALRPIAALDWCIGYELTKAQHGDLDEARDNIITTLSIIDPPSGVAQPVKSLSDKETAELLGGTLERPSGGYKIISDILSAKPNASGEAQTEGDVG